MKISRASHISPAAPFIPGPAAAWYVCCAAFYGRGGAVVLSANYHHTGECYPVGTGWSWVKDLQKTMPLLMKS